MMLRLTPFRHKTLAKNKDQQQRANRNSLPCSAQIGVIPDSRHNRSINKDAKKGAANVPHPAIFSSYLKSHPAQMLKSWYAMFFQLPGLPERFVKAANWKFLIGAMPDYWEENLYDRYREAWDQPGAITAMINWYRATFSRSGRPRNTDAIQPPTLIIWGKNDPHLSHQMAPLSLEHCRDGILVYFEDASHWVQHDKPQEISQLLIDHFQKD